MATVNGSGSINNQGVFKHSWTITANGDDGEPIRVAQYGNIVTVQVDVDAAGTWVLEGSNNNGTSWQALRVFDFDTGDYIFLTAQTASGLFTLVDVPELVRPRLTAGASPDIKFNLAVGTRK